MASNEAIWLLRALVTLAKLELAEANATCGEDWPGGQQWHQLVGSSQSIFMHRARDKAGIPHDEYLKFVRSVDDDDINDLWAELARPSTAETASRRPDTERLDWLEQNGADQFQFAKSGPLEKRWFDWSTPGIDYSPTLRAAIDAARGVRSSPDAAPSAAAPLTAEPSREGSEQATVGAARSPIRGNAVAEYRAAMSTAVPKEPLQVYDSNSWRRVGLQSRYKPVMVPTRAADGHPDISGEPILRALVASFNAMLELMPEVERLRWELAIQTRLAADRNVTIGTLGQEIERLRDYRHRLSSPPCTNPEGHSFTNVSPGCVWCGIHPGWAPFQARVADWMDACFGPEIAKDRTERNHRFLEEALELVQAGGCSKSEVLQLVDYVFGRPAGVISQEVGGVTVTLAALCEAFKLDMNACAEEEITRVWIRMPQIRAKQAAKPKFSPLPETTSNTTVQHQSV